MTEWRAPFFFHGPRDTSLKRRPLKLQKVSEFGDEGPVQPEDSLFFYASAGGSGFNLSDGIEVAIVP